MRRLVVVTSTLAAVLSAAPALAVQGEQPVLSLQGERAQRLAHPHIQRTLAQSPAWQDFLARRGGRWSAQFDEATGTPVRFYGTGWDVDAETLAGDEGALALAREILEQEIALLGPDVRASQLRPLGVHRSEGIVTVTFQQTVGGLRVDRTRLSLRFKADRFVMGQVETLPTFDVPTTPDITVQQALTAASLTLGWEPEAVLDAELVVLPLRGESSYEARLAWRLELSNGAERSHPIVWVDALAGRTLGWQEQVRFAGGTILGEVDDRYPENGLTELGLRFASVSGDAGNATADTNAQFTLPGAAPDDITMQPGSQHFEINSSGGGSTFYGELTSDGGDVVVAPDPNGNNGAQRRQRALLDAHVAAHIVRDAALEMNPQFSWAQVEAEVNVNLDEGGCNAFFEPAQNPSGSSINFLRQGGGCNNTARIWDVIFHEYGHGFHLYNIVWGAGDFDGAISEGFSDYLAGTITGDSGMARGFFSGSSQPLRDLGPNQVWPDDVDGDPHITGLIAAGALWDTRTALMASMGDEAGKAWADQLFLAANRRASDTLTVYEEVLLADDDNGNLADGTPNLCIINDAFSLHGLGPGGNDVAVISVDFEPLGADMAAGQPIPVALDATVTNAECSQNAIASARVLWSADPNSALGSFEATSMTPSGGDTWAATLPAFADGTYLRYRIEVLDDGGNTVFTLPAGSVTDPWAGAWVGGEVLYEEDFESSDGGYESTLLAGPDQEGANDWMWAEPKGGGGDPLGAASGDRAWGNDLQPEPNWNGQYQGDVRSYLSSPAIDVGDGRVWLQFNRWLTVEDGVFDQAWVEVNGQVVWENYASPNQNNANSAHTDLEWQFRSYEITDLVEDGEVVLEWHLQTDAGLEFGGWTIDDVRIVGGEGGGIVGDDDDSVGDDDDAAVDDDDATGGGNGFAGNGCTCDSGAASPRPSALVLLLGLAGLVGGLRRRR